METGKISKVRLSITMRFSKSRQMWTLLPPQIGPFKAIWQCLLKAWNLVKILKFGQNSWNLAEILKLRQNPEIRLKSSNLVKIQKLGHQRSLCSVVKDLLLLLLLLLIREEYFKFQVFHSLWHCNLFSTLQNCGKGWACAPYQIPKLTESRAPQVSCYST